MIELATLRRPQDEETDRLLSDNVNQDHLLDSDDEMRSLPYDRDAQYQPLPNLPQPRSSGSHSDEDHLQLSMLTPSRLASYFVQSFITLASFLMKAPSTDVVPWDEAYSDATPPTCLPPPIVAARQQATKWLMLACKFAKDTEWTFFFISCTASATISAIVGVLAVLFGVALLKHDDEYDALQDSTWRAGALGGVIISPVYPCVIYLCSQSQCEWRLSQIFSCMGVLCLALNTAAGAIGAAILRHLAGPDPETVVISAGEAAVSGCVGWAAMFAVLCVANFLVILDNA